MRWVLVSFLIYLCYIWTLSTRIRVNFVPASSYNKTFLLWKHLLTVFYINLFKLRVKQIHIWYLDYSFIDLLLLHVFKKSNSSHFVEYPWFFMLFCIVPFPICEIPTPRNKEGTIVCQSPLIVRICEGPVDARAIIQIYQVAPGPVDSHRGAWPMPSQTGSHCFVKCH